MLTFEANEILRFAFLHITRKDSIVNENSQSLFIDEFTNYIPVISNYHLDWFCDAIKNVLVNELCSPMTLDKWKKLLVCAQNEVARRITEHCED